MGKKQAYELEFVFRASPTILYNFLTTPSGLAQWFADDVDVTGDEYSFVWSGGEPEKAFVLERIENELLRLRWEDSPEDEYLEFRIEKSEVTSDTVLFIVDFAEKFDIEAQTLLWESQISNLQIRIGG